MKDREGLLSQYLFLSAAWHAVFVVFVVALFASPAVAGNLVLNASGGTLTLTSTDWTLAGATVSNPAGTASFDCPITNVQVGTYQTTYSCSGGSYSFQSNDGETTVSASFTTGTIILTASGGGRGGHIKYAYQFVADVSGTETINGVTAAIIGESNL